MRETYRSHISTGKEAHITQAVAAASRCYQVSHREIKFPFNPPPGEIEEFRSASELLRAAPEERV
jgi:hypothetical protein